MKQRYGHHRVTATAGHHGLAANISSVFVHVSWRKWATLSMLLAKPISILLRATVLLIVKHRAYNKSLLSPLRGWDWQTAAQFSSPKAWRYEPNEEDTF